MNCSLALLEAVAKYAFEIGLKPLSKEKSECKRDWTYKVLTFACRTGFRSQEA